MANRVLILAAGAGTRMKSPVPKVLHPILGRSMLGWVMAAAAELSPHEQVVVVGHGAEAVEASLPKGTKTALQHEQLGTGHAVQVAWDSLDADPDDMIVILYGDTPMITSESLSDMLDAGTRTGAAAIVAELEDPTGYGRMIKDGDGRFIGIIEDRDCTPEQRSERQVNAGMYAIRAELLEVALGSLTNDNSQGELYLTDAVNESASKVEVVLVEADPDEIEGVNSQAQLADAALILRKIRNRELAESGVAILDPASTFVDASVVVEPGATILPNTQLIGATTVATGASVGPGSMVVDSSVGAGAHVWYSVVREATLGPNTEVGPYTSLRPGTVLAEGAKVGSFAETKNAEIGAGAKIPHLSYIGDALVGERANIGAGTITCNYDGVDKFRTEIGADAFIGSDTMLVAPVRIGDRAVTGAGSTITQDVPDGALSVERSDQRVKDGYGDALQVRKAAKKRS